MNAQTALKPARITVDSLIRLDTLSDMEKALERRLEAIKIDRKALEEQLVAQVEAGAEIPTGFNAEVRASQRRYPHWREIFIERHGVAEAEALLTATPPTITKRLIIKKVA